jgi:predicted HTH domain antitoxin
MTITIPDETLKELKISAGEMLIDVAVYLYDKERLTLGQARKLAGLDILAFQKELASRNVYLKYNIDDLNADIKNLTRL